MYIKQYPVRRIDGVESYWKINGGLRFLSRNSSILSPNLKRMLCNSLIQPHFDYAALIWYPNLRMKLKKKIQTSQKKAIRFCLQLDNRTSVNSGHFKTINWLNTFDRFRKTLNSSAFEFFHNNCLIFIAN